MHDPCGCGPRLPGAVRAASSRSTSHRPRCRPGPRRHAPRPGLRARRSGTSTGRARLGSTLLRGRSSTTRMRRPHRPRPSACAQPQTPPGGGVRSSWSWFYSSTDHRHSEVQKPLIHRGSGHEQVTIRGACPHPGGVVCGRPRPEARRRTATTCAPYPSLLLVGDRPGTDRRSRSSPRRRWGGFEARAWRPSHLNHQVLRAREAGGGPQAAAAVPGVAALSTADPGRTRRSRSSPRRRWGGFEARAWRPSHLNHRRSAAGKPGGGPQTTARRTRRSCLSAADPDGPAGRAHRPASSLGPGWSSATRPSGPAGLDQPEGVAASDGLGESERDSGSRIGLDSSSTWVVRVSRSRTPTP